MTVRVVDIAAGIVDMVERAAGTAAGTVDMLPSVAADSARFFCPPDSPGRRRADRSVVPHHPDPDHPGPDLRRTGDSQSCGHPSHPSRRPSHDDILRPSRQILHAYVQALSFLLSFILYRSEALSSGSAILLLLLLVLRPGSHQFLLYLLDCRVWNHPSDIDNSVGPIHSFFQLL